MDIIELNADLSLKRLELEKAIDEGMPYPFLKAINLEIKNLQYQIALLNKEMIVKQDNGGTIIQ
jgi:hypothetical protein